jgi:hypothetical protein
MNSPYRAHPASQSSPLSAGKTIPFPAGQGRAHAAPHSTSSSAPAHTDTAARLIKLVSLEGDIRQQPSVAALMFHAVNDSRTLLGFRQGWFFRQNRRGRFVLEAVSDVAAVDLNAPLVLAATRLVNSAGVTAVAQDVSLGPLQASGFPLRHGLLVPLCDGKGKVFAVLMLAREQAWPEAERPIALRIAQTYAHALRALTPPSLLLRWSLPRWAVIAGPLLAVALTLVPVPMTALAPFEVVAFQPRLITAPMDGVIASVDAEANTSVRAGDALFSLDATQLKAEAEIAAQKVQVAESRLATVRNGAFQDAEMKRSLATAEQELQLARAEQAYAGSLLARSAVRADGGGLLIYSQRNDWLGKPVRTGEKVMEIADPSRVSYRIELAVSDSIALGGSNSVWLFLDADPLKPRSAVIAEASYHAHTTAEGGMAYVITARPTDEAAPARIGLRGTAQIVGERVPLGFYLLRRPIAALRQRLGW